MVSFDFFTGEIFMPHGRYINPFTDFGFKKIFGEEANSDLLIDFLNQVIDPNDMPITEINFLPPEQLGRTETERRPIFDLYCKNQRGEYFIIEMQKAEQDYFIDRSIYYSSFPIQQQGKRGKDFNYKLSKIYTIGILDFIFQDDDILETRAELYDFVRGRKFHDGITYIYLEMPKFKKTLKELDTRFDKWMFILSQLQDLDRMPKALQDQIFTKVFDVAELAALSKKDLAGYEDSLKVYRDTINTTNTGLRKAREEGLAEGREKGLIEGIAKGEAKGKVIATLEIYKNMISKNIKHEDALKFLGISDGEWKKNFKRFLE